MVQKYSIFAAIQANDVMRNAYLINLVRVLCGLPVSGDSTGELRGLNLQFNIQPSLQYSPNEAQDRLRGSKAKFLSRRPRINDRK